MTDLVGQSIGSYQIVARLGKGGMGDVYRARQTLGGGLVRDVALKLIDSRLASAPEFVARFKREAQTLVALSHPHILKAFDFGEYQDTVYLVMELMPGGSLTDLISKGPLPFDLITRLLDQIGSALDYAHREGVIHRDLKPQNVLLDNSNNAFLTDFGIVKLVSQTSALTHTNESVGTPAYMAPEQWLRSAVDARADLYSLGVMLFEMVGGQVPFQGDTPFRVMHLHANEPPPLVQTVRPDAPAALDQVIHKAMAKDPADRYQSATALAADVRAALSGGVVNAPLITPVSKASRPLPNTPTSVVAPGSQAATAATTAAVRSGPPRAAIGVIVGAAVVLALAIGVGLAVIGAQRSATSAVTPTLSPSQNSIALGASVTSSPLPPTASVTPTVTITSTPSVTDTVTESATSTPSNTETLNPTATGLPSPTTIPSATTLPTATTVPSKVPTLAPTLSIPQLAGTLKASGQTQTATLWTHTPIPTLTRTPNVTASLAAYLTHSALTEAAQVALNQTATATLWTPTPTPTVTPTDTPTATQTSTPTVATLPPTSVYTPSATPIQTVFANSDWTPQIKLFKTVPMVLVPPGCFLMGSDTFRDNEKPANQVCFDKPFWIDEYPVTQGQFKQFGGQALHSPKWTGDKQPMEQISWFESRNYCESNRGMRLPTEAEYEYAIRGPDDLIFAWGNKFDPTKVVYHNNSNQRTADVNSQLSNVSWVGAIDLIGNVWEWTSTIYAPYPYDAHDGRENLADTTSTRVLRGNSASDLVQQASVRIDSAPTNAGDFAGLRCARNWQS